MKKRKGKNDDDENNRWRYGQMVDWFGCLEIHKIITVITMARFDSCFTGLITTDALPTRQSRIAYHSPSLCTNRDDASDCFRRITILFFSHHFFSRWCSKRWNLIQNCIKSKMENYWFQLNFPGIHKIDCTREGMEPHVVIPNDFSSCHFDDSQNGFRFYVQSKFYVWIVTDDLRMWTKRKT